MQGLQFMQEISEYALQQEHELAAFRVERVVQVVSEPHFGYPQFLASPAQFGMDLKNTKIYGEIATTIPPNGCSHIQNQHQLLNRIAVVQRGGCVFQKKAEMVEKVGAIGLIIVDNNIGTSAEKSPFFSMSADNESLNRNKIPVVFLFHLEGQKLLNQHISHPTMLVQLSEKVFNPKWIFEKYALMGPTKFFYSKAAEILSNRFFEMNPEKSIIRFNFEFGAINSESDPNFRHIAVEKSISEMEKWVIFSNGNYQAKFLNHLRVLAYSVLGYPHNLKADDFLELKTLIPHLRLKNAAKDGFMGAQQQQHPSKTTIECVLGKEPKNYACNEV